MKDDMTRRGLITAAALAGASPFVVGTFPDHALGAGDP